MSSVKRLKAVLAAEKQTANDNLSPWHKQVLAALKKTGVKTMKIRYAMEEALALEIPKSNASLSPEFCGLMKSLGCTIEIGTYMDPNKLGLTFAKS